MVKVCCNSGSHEQRLKEVGKWTTWKFAKECHPREEHLIPLFVNLGASEGKAGKSTATGLFAFEMNNFVFE